jgi:hypothetical protein
MNPSELDYWYQEESEETEKEYLTRMLYIRNFETPQTKLDNETNILRSTLETTRDRTEIARVASFGTTSPKRQRVVLDTRRTRKNRS